jgi:hypothetical protein
MLATRGSGLLYQRPSTANRHRRVQYIEFRGCSFFANVAGPQAWSEERRGQSSGSTSEHVLDGSYRIMRCVVLRRVRHHLRGRGHELGTMVAIKEYYPFDFGDRDHA